MAYKSFNAYDDECDRAERERPVCCSCGQPIWEDKAYLVNDCWFCADKNCESEFLEAVKEELLQCTV